MALTTSELVQGILLSDYGETESGELPSLTPFIDTAAVFMARVSTCASLKGTPLTVTEKEILERWLAAHFYAMSDQTYESRRTADSAGKFHGKTGMGLEASKYGQQAMSIDPSGCVASISKRREARLVWLGKNPTDQTDYVDRE